MASTQKKNTGGKRAASSSGKRTSGATARKGSGGRRSSAAPQPKPIRREVGAAVCLVLALFSGVGYFHVEALFIDFFCGLIRGLIGYGYWAVPPALLVAGVILAFHRGRPVRARVTCALLFPVMLGVLLHLFLAKGSYVLSEDFAAVMKALWTDGGALKAGGAVSGLLAVACVTAFSRIGSIVLFLVVELLLLMVAFHVSLADVVDWLRSRPRPEYEWEEEPEEKASPVRRQEAERRRRAQIDIPVDGEEEERQPKPRKERLFDRKPRVPQPHELLTRGAQAAVPAAAEAETPAPEAEHPVKEKDLAEIEPQGLPVLADEEQAVPDGPLPAPAREMPKPEQPEPSAAPEPLREAAASKLKRDEVEEAAAEVAESIESSLSQESGAYRYPPVSLLKELGGAAEEDTSGELRTNQARLEDTLSSFGIDAHIIDVVRGPSVTRYELELDRGVKLNKLTNLSDDIALSLGAAGVRIAPIPDKISVVGIEVPNKLVTPVPIRDVIDSKEFRDHTSKVAFAVGKDISNQCIVGNIAKLPHMLIAGTTGSGKSVCTNSLIISLLYKATPDEVRLIMVDPKMVELGIYNGIPHLLIPVVTDPKKAAGALQWAVTEMMKRYRAFSEIGVRDLASYNVHAARTEGMNKMPQIVVVIDELADLMLVAAKEVEESICRVAQMGRAAGMHLVIATQRPSADVITGLMKANIPSRIAFAVASSLESRIILDTTGAEKLVGRGDMLYAPLGSGKPQRVQGCLISDEEVAAVVEFVKQSGGANYSDDVIRQIEENVQAKEKGGKGGSAAAGEAPSAEEEGDELLPAAIEVVVETGMASVSMLQRRLKLGYSRAARLVDQMEERGIVGPFEGSKPRQVLVSKEQWQEMKLRGDGGEPVPEELPYEGDAVDQGPPPFDLE